MFSGRKIHSVTDEPTICLSLQHMRRIIPTIRFRFTKRSIREVDNHKISHGGNSGHGISALVDNIKVLAAMTSMEKFSIPFIKERSAGTMVHIAADGEYAGYILIADQTRRCCPGC